MKKSVIARKLLPVNSPIIFLTVLWLLLDRLNASSFWMGFYWGFVALILLCWIAILCNEKQCNLSELP
jgi:high-affinity Fe2+/Pb2+ permease